MGYARQQQQRANELLAAGAISKQELEQADTALRTAEAEPEGAAGAGAAAGSAASLLHGHRADGRHRRRRAGARRQPGDAPDRADDDRSERDARGERRRADRARRRSQDRSAAAGAGAATARSSIAATTVSFISPRVDDQTQSVLVKGNVQEPGRRAARVAVRARAHRLEDGGRPGRAGDGGAAHQRPVLRVRRRAGSRRQALTAKQRAIKVGPIVGDNYPVLDGIKPGDASSCRARRSWRTARRFRTRPARRLRASNP